MSDPTKYEGQIVSERDAASRGKSVVQLWMDKINAAKEEEKGWRESAKIASELYEAEKSANSNFNIYHANVETTIPALYNSTPIPDVRRRYEGEAVDPAKFPPPPQPQEGSPPEAMQQWQMAAQQAKQAYEQEAQALKTKNELHRDIAECDERALNFSVDEYCFDDVMEDQVRDAQVTGRGVPRIRHKVLIANGGIEHEMVQAELVPWDRFIRGPGYSWDLVPWIAFEHDLTQDEVRKLLQDEPDAAERLTKLGFSAASDDGTDHGAEKERDSKHKGILKTLKAYEIWDKLTGVVLFITPQDKDKPLTQERDPLGLTGFFCTPKPMQFVRRTRSLVPVCPYDVYKPLIEEINTISQRIAALIKQLKVKGGYDPKMAPDFEKLQDADDGVYVPITASEQFVQGSGGLEKAVMHWPVEQIIKVVQGLYQEREAIKQTIYEVMGIADVVRGQVDHREKAAQSKIKEESGARRLKRAQKEVARIARDLFRMKSEIMMGKFQRETLQNITGMTISDEMEQVMRQDKRGFSIDIETDSTVRADMGRYQEEMNEFVMGTAQFGQAIAAMAPVMPQMVAPMTEVFSCYAGKFNLGKTGEDALDRLIEAGKEPPVQPDNGAEAARMEAEARKQEMDGKMQMEREKHQGDMALKGKDIELKDKDMMLKEIEIMGKREAAQIEAEARRMEMGAKAEGIELDRQVRAEDRDHQRQMAEIKRKQAMQSKPQAGA